MERSLADRPLRVLLAEDEVSLLGPLAKRLRHEYGYEVDPAADLIEARKLLLQTGRPYDVALIDDLLAPAPGEEPEYVGIALLREIKERWPETEVIIFTGWGMERALEALQAGAYRYLAKPLNLDELGMTIRMAAEQVRLRQVSKAHDIAKIVAEVSILEDLQGTLISVVKGTQEALQCDAVALYTYDQNRDEFGFPPAMIGIRAAGDVLKLGLVAKESRIRGILALEEPYVTEDAPSDPTVGGGFIEREDIKSLAGIPLKVGDRKVGLMFVNYRSRHRFTEEEFTSIELFAYQAAVAIRNAQLYEEVTRRANVLEALYEAGKAVTSTLALDEILDRIVEQAVSFPSRHGKQAHLSDLMLVEGRKLKPCAAHPPEHLAELQRVMGGIDLEHDKRIGVQGRAARTGLSQLVGDVTCDPDYVEYDSATHSALAVPIKLGEENVTGVISVEHPDYSVFDEDDQRNLEFLAAQAAIAIQNARLYQQATERLSESQALQQVATSLAGTLGLEEVLQVVMMAATRLTDTDSGSILFWDSQAKAFTHVLTTAGPDGELRPYRSSVRREGGIARAIIDGREPVVMPDTLKDPRVSPVAIRKGRRALVGVPLMSREEPIGVLYVSSSEIQVFSSRQVMLLETLASQAAVAIERARQYEELRQTKGLVGARTALAWMGMASSAWRHGIVKHALTIKEQSQLLRDDMGQVLSQGHHLQAEKRLRIIQRLTQQILEKPITPPLSAEEGASSVAINGLIRERTKQLWQSEPYRSVELNLDLHLDDQATVRASSEWLRRALDVLVDNAVEAVADCAPKRITVATQQKDKQAEILVSDTGTGFPEEDLAVLLWEPIRKLKGAKGLGMGLLMAQAIVQTYGGEIKVGATGPTGTTMCIMLPLETSTT